MTRPNFLELAADVLQRAGHPVTSAEGIGGLWDVAGIGRDLTAGQVLDIARRFGGISAPVLPSDIAIRIVAA